MAMTRREFLRSATGGLLAGMPAAPRTTARPHAAPTVMTVLGPVAAARLGSTLCHEHVLVDFVGADRIAPGRYDPDEVFAVALPFLRQARRAGCRAFVECTPAYLGRDPQLLARLARASGLHILTNTGYYGAAKDKYLPHHAHDEDADALARRWAREWEAGIDGTGIRPGFVKTGVDAGPLSAIDRTLVRAAARTHARTGLPIASHTGDTRAGIEQLEVLSEEGIGADAFIWVHAQSDWQLDARAGAARKGAWIEIDDIAPASVARCVGQATALRDRGLVGRLLVSHDAGWYRPGEPRGGTFRGFDTVHAAFVPALRRAGWTAAEIRQVMVANPAAAFSIRARR